VIPLFSVLQKVAPRWCSLVLIFSPTFYTAFLGAVTCSPLLDTLRLIDEPSAKGNFFLPHTPSLKHLDIQSCIPLSCISLDWGTLTTFEGDSVTLDEFFEVLRCAERLNLFRLRGVIENVEEYPLPTTPLTHSSLTQLYLEISGDLGTDEEPLFDLAVFPSLEKFGCRISDVYCLPIRALQSLFDRSHCQLTHFDLLGELDHDMSDDLISILADMPSITHLKLEDTYSTTQEEAIMSDELLRMLYSLLPRLESLEFLGYKTFSWSCLASLVSSTSPDGGLILPTRSESQRKGKTNSIRRISFTVYFQGEREFIDVLSLARFKDACYAGISIDIVNVVPPGNNPPLSSYDAVGNCLFPLDLLS
jgi:hypothetical protein